jgi:hypothetical protein
LILETSKPAQNPKLVYLSRSYNGQDSRFISEDTSSILVRDSLITKPFLMTSKNSMKTVKSMVLPDHFTEAGIKSELTQNDVIELIATRKIEAITEEFDSLNLRHQSILQFRKEFEVEQVKLFTKEIRDIIKKDPREYTSKDVSHYIINENKGNSNEEKHSLLQVVEIRGKKTLSFDVNGVDPLNENSILVMRFYFSDTVSEETEIKGFTHNIYNNRKHSFEKKVHFPRKFIQDFNKTLFKHCENVNAFYNKYKGVDLDADKIIKATRTKFNTKLLKAKSPLLHSQIEGLFDVQL